MKSLSFLLVLAFSFVVLADVGQKDAIKSVLQKYVTAFDSKNFLELKKTASEHFILTTGGETTWRERFVPAPKAKGGKNSKIRDLKIVQRKNITYVRFNTKDKMPDGQWFILKQVDGRWLIDDLINDFNPEN